MAHEFDVIYFLIMYFFCNFCFKSLIAVAFLLPLCTVNEMVMVLIFSLGYFRATSEAQDP